MPTIRFETAANTAELIDAGEALEALLETRDEALDLTPALLRLLLALDEAITDAVRDGGANARA